ncbi:MAG TPA: periplasmic heavy metal sensor [Thermodesulfobacteriota bacterium]
MTRRTMIGLGALLTVGLVAGWTAVAAGHWGHGWRDGMMKRVVSSLLDEANVTDEQRQRIHAARDRVFAAVEAQRGARQDHLERALALFEADQVDEQQVAALHQEAEARRREIAEAMHQALLEVHDVLTPEQRRVLADHVRNLRARHH